MLVPGRRAHAGGPRAGGQLVSDGPGVPVEKGRSSQQTAQKQPDSHRARQQVSTDLPPATEGRPRRAADLDTKCKTRGLPGDNTGESLDDLVTLKFSVNTKYTAQERKAHQWAVIKSEIRAL